jgi:hypothetical protein
MCGHDQCPDDQHLGSEQWSEVLAELDLVRVPTWNDDGAEEVLHYLQMKAAFHHQHCPCAGARW